MTEKSKSKQAQAKEAQSYTTEVQNCGNCARMEFDMRPPAWMQSRVDSGEYTQAYANGHAQEYGHRCSVGKFAVKKTAGCAIWVAKGKS